MHWKSNWVLKSKVIGKVSLSFATEFDSTTDWLDRRIREFKIQMISIKIKDKAMYKPNCILYSV